MLVDPEDYAWATGWCWFAKLSNGAENRRRKVYAFRNYRVGGRGGINVSIWLHREICRRAHGEPPSPAHVTADHWNGDSLDCRRANLRWATRSENNANRSF